MREVLGFNQPIPERFVRFIANAVQGNFGNSIWQQVPAMGLVLERLPATLWLCVSAMILALLIGIPLGIVAALNPTSRADKVASLLSLSGVSIPEFWLAITLILLVAVNLRLLPTSGYGDWNHLVLPALSLAALAGGRVTQIVRSAMIDELSKPYIVTAQSKGVAPAQILRRHALRNAAIPIISLSGWELAHMLAGAIVSVELIFAWPGVGQLAIQAALRHDVPLIQATVFVVAVMVAVINILVDLSYSIADPRVKLH
jgi:peptide/nickel transport system permease protein